MHADVSTTLEYNTVCRVARCSGRPLIRNDVILVPVKIQVAGKMLYTTPNVALTFYGTLGVFENSTLCHCGVRPWRIPPAPQEFSDKPNLH